MSIYAISDLHGQLPPIPNDTDALLIVGDICPNFSSSDDRRLGLDKGGTQQADWLDVEFRAWLDTAPSGCQVVAIWGNHDFVGEHPDLIPDLPWTLLQDSETTLELPAGPIRIYGTPWVPGLPYWAFYASETALKLRADAIPEGLDILMTHGPPYGVCDFIPTSPKQREKYGNYDGKHVGDRALTEALCRLSERSNKTPITLCGHIHEARGGKWHYKINLVCNVAAVDENYNLYEEPFTCLFED